MTLDTYIHLPTFSYGKAYVTKFNLSVKKVNVNPGSSFEATMMGPSPRCYIPSFVEICPLVPEKTFEGFFTIYGRGRHVGHVNEIPRTNFCSPYLWRLYTKCGLDWLSGFGREDV